MARETANIEVIDVSSGLNTFINPHSKGQEFHTLSYNLDYSSNQLQSIVPMLEKTSDANKWDANNYIFMTGWITRTDSTGMILILIGQDQVDNKYYIYKSDGLFSKPYKLDNNPINVPPIGKFTNNTFFSGDSSIISDRFRLSMGKSNTPKIYQYINRTYWDGNLSYEGYHLDIARPRNESMVPVATKYAVSGGSSGAGFLSASKHYFWKIVPVFDGIQVAPLPNDYIHVNTGSGDNTYFQKLAFKIDKNTWNPRQTGFDIYRAESNTEIEKDLTYYKIKSFSTDLLIGDDNYTDNVWIGKTFTSGALGYGDDYSALNSATDDTGCFVITNYRDSKGSCPSVSENPGIGIYPSTSTLATSGIAADNNMLHGLINDLSTFSPPHNTATETYHHTHNVTEVFNTTGGAMDFLKLDKVIPETDYSEGQAEKEYLICSRDNLVRNGLCADVQSAVQWFKKETVSSSAYGSSSVSYQSDKIYLKQQSALFSDSKMRRGYNGVATNLNWDGSTHSNLVTGEYLVSIHVKKGEFGSGTLGDDDPNGKLRCEIFKGVTVSSNQGGSSSWSIIPASSSDIIADEHLKNSNSWGEGDWRVLNFTFEVTAADKYCIYICGDGFEDADYQSRQIYINNIVVSKIVNRGRYTCGDRSFMIKNTPGSNVALVNNVYAGGKLILPTGEPKLISGNQNTLFTLAVNTPVSDTEMGDAVADIRSGTQIEDEPAADSQDTDYVNKLKFEWSDMGGPAVGTHPYQKTSIDIKFEHSCIIEGRQYVANVKLQNTEATEQESQSNYIMFSELNQLDVIPVTNYIQIDDIQGGEITALGSLMGDLIVFMQDSIWRINIPSYDPSQWSAVEVNKTIGCNAKQSIAQWGNGIIFATQDALYFADSNFSLNEISKPFQTEYRNYYDDSVKVKIDRFKQLLYIVISGHTYILDLKILKEQQDLKWTKRRFEDQDTNESILLGNDEDGKLYIIDKKTDETKVHFLSTTYQELADDGGGTLSGYETLTGKFETGFIPLTDFEKPVIIESLFLRLDFVLAPYYVTLENEKGQIKTLEGRGKSFSQHIRFRNVNFRAKEIKLGFYTYKLAATFKLQEMGIEIS